MDGSKAKYVRRANEFLDMQSLKNANVKENKEIFSVKIPVTPSLLVNTEIQQLCWH